MNSLENAKKCESISGYLDDGYCHVDEFILKDTKVSCENDFKGIWVIKNFDKISGMNKIGTAKPGDHPNFKICKFPLENINNPEQKQFKKLETNAKMRVYNRELFKKSIIDKKIELANDTQLLNIFLEQAKMIINSGQTYAPLMFVKKGDNEIAIIKLKFANQEEKDRLINKLRNIITNSNVQKYWIMMEAWIGSNPFILPRYDIERKEVVVITEYDKDQIETRRVQLEFDRKNGKPEWIRKKEILSTPDEGADRWNFFVEDVIDEKTKLVRLDKLDKDLEKIKKQFMEEKRKQGFTEEQIKIEEKKFDEMAERVRKKFKKMPGDLWPGGV